jgi:pSer/pThr/pTyr-binding forkhead associated (FHA) protein
MVKCPVCQVKYPENTLFCEECGAYLSGDRPEETDPLAMGEVAWMEREETREPAEEDITSPLGLKLTIPDSEQNVEVLLTREVNIGRLDPISASFPDVDLTSESGLERGVSRRHAKITRRGREVFIEDLGSLNGTFLNREKLAPFLPQAIKSGDELQLGGLKLRVSFTR